MALVLGPGGAKALAHAGVIKALQENHIPINRIVGIEWGALVAASFAIHGQFHEVDWKLYRLDQVDLSAKGLFGIGHGDRTIKVLDGYLKENFGNIDYANLKIPFSCPARNYWTGALDPPAAGTIERRLTVRVYGFHHSFKSRGNWIAGATAEPTDCRAAEKPKTFRIVIFVDVLGAATSLRKKKASRMTLTA